MQPSRLQLEDALLAVCLTIYTTHDSHLFSFSFGSFSDYGAGGSVMAYHRSILGLVHSPYPPRMHLRGVDLGSALVS
jgi:hypothetical protein